MTDIKLAALAILAILSAAACNKEIHETKEGGIIIDAVAGSLGTPDTKAVGVYGYQVVWESGDRIVVTDKTTQATFELVEGQGEILGKFAQVGTATLTGEVTGYYPASILKSDGTIKWPTAQKWSESLTGIPMTANATITGTSGTPFYFESLGGMLNLVLTTTEGNIPMKSITVSADNLDSPIVLDCTGLSLSSSARTASIAIPAGNLANVQLRFETSAGAVRTLTSSSLVIKKSVVSKVTLAVDGFAKEGPDYMSFTAVNSDIRISMIKSYNPATIDFEYLDPVSGKWTGFKADASVDNEQTILTLGKDRTVFLRGKTPRTTLSRESGCWRFVFDNMGNSNGRIAANGNIMSLLDPEAKSTTVGDYAFASLFEQATILISAPKLPATSLGEYCYKFMFDACTRLTEAPELPAGTLKEGCYLSMFSNTGLKKAARMSACVLAPFCCTEMYLSCESLETTYPLTAPKMDVECYCGMFYYCSALKYAPDLPATELARSCYQNMFQSCSSLVKAPELPATKLENNCYTSMFSYCTSLVEAPYLPATDLAENCYVYLFRNCTSLKKISVGFSDWENEEIPDTYRWTLNVPSGGTFYCPAGLEKKYNDGNSDYIPAGWTVVNSTLPSGVYPGMTIMADGFEGVYVGDDSEKRKIVFTSKNFGAQDKFDIGVAYDADALGDLMDSGATGSWELPTESDMAVLAKNGLYNDWNEGVSQMIGIVQPYYYYIPFTDDAECRLWLADRSNYYYFNIQNKYGVKPAVTSESYRVRLVKRF